MRVCHLGLIALMMIPFVPALAGAAEPEVKLPEKVRKHLQDSFFKGKADAEVDGAVEFLSLPPSMLGHIAANTWESGQLEKFAKPKLFFIAKCPDGKTRAFHYRNETHRNTAELTTELERSLRRLYSDASFSAKPHEKLDAELRKSREWDAQAELTNALSSLEGQDQFKLDADTVKRLRENYAKCHHGGRPLAVALCALGNTEHAVEATWAALWLISRMDQMIFYRADDAGEKADLSRIESDLQTVDSQTFFENVFYAVKARHLPWGAAVAERDFLHQVLSPRGTGEPLQRWRKHFFEAMEPEITGWNKDDMRKAEAFATSLAYSFYQYEGDTSWEDFGMLTALAVHEGRCEDCSNVENCMKRALGLPAAQAFTPWWGHCNGNHAWTVLAGLPNQSRDGSSGVKVFLKTWDGLDDVTDQNTKVTRVEFDSKAKEGVQAELHVWNHESWRRVAKSPVKAGKVVLEKVGCSREFLLLIKVEGEADRLLRVHKSGQNTLLNNAADITPGDKAFEAEFGKQSELGEFKPDQSYIVKIHTLEGWKEIATQRLQTGAIKFKAEGNRAYLITGEGMTDRPFTLTLEDGASEPTVVKH